MAHHETVGRLAIVLLLLAVCGCRAGRVSAPMASRSDPAGFLETRVQAVQQAYLRFGTADPAEWKRGRAELRREGAPLVGAEALALVDRSESEDESRAAPARLALWRCGRMPELLAGMHGDNYDQWLAAKQEVLKLGAEGKEAAILACILAFTGEHANRHELARRLLIDIGPDAVPYLALAFDVATERARAAAQEDGTEQMPATHTIVREQCALGLAQLGPIGQAELLKHAASPDEGVRLAVVRALPDAERNVALAGLRRALGGDRSWRVRAQGAIGLGRLRDPDGIEALTAAQQDPDLFVRHRAAIALGAIGGERAVTALCVALLSAPRPASPPGPEPTSAYRAGPPTPDETLSEYRLCLIRTLGASGSRRPIEPLYAELARFPAREATPLYLELDRALRKLTGAAGWRVRTAAEWRRLIDADPAGK
ncbi:MAG: HEAT repeat domain-containing protein [Planctomycetes bacterium]|nr:HEAT repeat domain-containing protein [Planctomycetota bacterium]